MIRLLYAIPSWALFFTLRVVLIVVGYIVVSIGLLLKNYHIRPSKYYARDIRAWKSSLLWLWGNEEEGIGWYGDSKWPLWRRILYSECVRNPVNNLRYVPFLSLKVDPAKIDFRGSLGNNKSSLAELVKYDSNDYDFWSFTWQGAYSCFRWQGRLLGARRRFWIGWKIYPEDIYGLPVWSHRNVSAGFATQFKVIGE